MYCLPSTLYEPRYRECRGLFGIAISICQYAHRTPRITGRLSNEYKTTRGRQRGTNEGVSIRTDHSFSPVVDQTQLRRPIAYLCRQYVATPVGQLNLATGGNPALLDDGSIQQPGFAAVNGVGSLLAAGGGGHISMRFAVGTRRMVSSSVIGLISPHVTRANNAARVALPVVRLRMNRCPFLSK
jgi:hypothetical protein